LTPPTGRSTSAGYPRNGSFFPSQPWAGHVDWRVRFESTDEIVRSLFLARLGLAGLALVATLPLLVYFTWLREYELFWTNAGGYPVVLRELVLTGYIPILVFNSLLGLLYFGLLLARPVKSRRVLAAEFAFLVLTASIITGCVVYDIFY